MATKDALDHEDDQELVWHVRDSGWREAEWDCLYVVQHTGHADDDRIDGFIANVERFLAKRSRAGLLVLPGLQVRPPSAAARKRAIAMMKSNQGTLQGAALWSPAEGMFASAIRSVTTAIFAFGAPWLKAKVCGDRAALVTWASEFSKRSSADVDAMLDVVFGDLPGKTQM
ncbi:MAG: hypothetical protein AB8H86_06255 [Polyangiales bacterium]